MADDISDRKAPGFWFYTSDFERDMQILPLGAQGLWIRMMCWMSENEMHRGFAELPTGEPMTELDIAHRVGKPIKEIRSALDAMRRLGTFSEDSRGCIFSRRMARDTHISEVRRQAALKRASAVERAKDGSFAPAKSPAKREQNPTVPVPVPVPVTTTPEAVHTHSSVEWPEVRQIACASRGPVAADLNGHTSQRFGEFFERYPRRVHKDAACRQWVMTVDIDSEAAVFACLERYLASDEVSRGVVSNPENWLRQQHGEQWDGRWPARAAPQRKLSVTERAKILWEQENAK